MIVDENGNETEKTVALPKINAPYSYLDAIKEAGFDFLVTANNHTMDKGNAGVAATIEQIRQRALKHTGSSDSDDRNITVTEVDGINICILNYTMFINSGTQQPASVNTVNFYSLDAFKADITEARSKGAEYVIVYMHWGDEHKPITNIQRKTAKELADNGADLIIGSHPHILQPAEIIKTSSGNRSEVLCVYSLGNYISSMASTASRDTIMLHVKLRRWQSGRIDTVFAQYKPYVSGGRFEVAYPSEGAVQRISNTMGEKLTLVDNFQYG